MTATEPMPQRGGADVRELDDPALAATVSAAGPDRPPLVDPEYAPLLAELAELDERAARGDIAIGDLLDRQAAFFRGAYLPFDIPGPVERRYRLTFTGPDTPGFGQVKVAAKDSGKLYALNGFPPVGGSASGTAEAAIGILVRPAHAISRLTFTPYVSYAFGHRADVPTAQGKVNFATSAGELDLVVDRINPVTGTGEPFLRKSFPLWQKYTGTGAGYGWVHGHGQFPGANLGLQVIAGSGDLLAMWVVVRVSLSKQDFDPHFFTTGQAYLDCDIPFMWVDEVSLT